MPEKMRDRMERLVILPFPVGCISEACVAVDIPHPRRSKPDTNSPTAAIIKGPKGEEDILESLSGESMESSLRLLDAVPKSNISTGFNRLFKGFKNFNQLFVDKEEELGEEEMDMEIGCPTDVRHVTHIGWDGIATSSDPIKGWKDLISAELLALSSLPLEQYELSTLEPKPQASSSSSIHLPYEKPSPN